MRGQDDASHLATATSLGAVLVSQNQRDFDPLHDRWQAAGREHAGILTATQRLPTGIKIQRLERAARLLTSETAHNLLMKLPLFDTEEGGQAYVLSLLPLDH